jgi:hypothetical protein
MCLQVMQAPGRAGGKLSVKVGKLVLQLRVVEVAPLEKPVPGRPSGNPKAGPASPKSMLCPAQGFQVQDVLPCTTHGLLPEVGRCHECRGFSQPVICLVPRSKRFIYPTVIVLRPVWPAKTSKS